MDLVFTDIRMAEVSGLELSKYIYENCPDTKVVIISGYKDFEYAKKAIEYNVKHYLLKPTRFDEINRIVSEIRESLDSESKRQQAIQEKMKKYQEMLPLLQEQFFVDLIAGALTDISEIERKIKLLELDLDIGSTVCSIIEVRLADYSSFVEDKWKYGKERLGTVIRNFIKYENDKINYYPIFSHFDHIKVLAVSSAYDDANEFAAEIEQHLFEVSSSIEKILGLHIVSEITHSFGSIFELVNNIDNMYRDTEKQGYDGMEAGAENAANIEKCKLIISNITAGNPEEACNIAVGMINKISNLAIEKIHEQIINMFTLIYCKLSDAGIQVPNIKESGYSYYEVVKVKDVEEIKKWCKDLITRITQLVSRSGKSGAEIVIEKAKDYIGNNFDKDISLEDVAEHIFLSPVYFSRFFKQQTGENFTDYLIKVRMNYAIKLLTKSNLKVYEISDRVGYKNSKYFTRLFKKYTGYTPKEYQKHFNGE